MEDHPRRRGRPPRRMPLAHRMAEKKAAESRRSVSAARARKARARRARRATRPRPAPVRL
jgi:hypothetical protein